MNAIINRFVAENAELKTSSEQVSFSNSFSDKASSTFYFNIASKITHDFSKTFAVFAQCVSAKVNFTKAYNSDDRAVTFNCYVGFGQYNDQCYLTDVLTISKTGTYTLKSNNKFAATYITSSVTGMHDAGYGYSRVTLSCDSTSYNFAGTLTCTMKYKFLDFS